MMNTDFIIKQLNLKGGNSYIKYSGKTNTIQKIDFEKIKYNIDNNNSKYIRLSLLLDCHNRLLKEKTLLVEWIKSKHKTQPCDLQLILALFVKAGIGKYFIPEGKTRPIGINCILTSGSRNIPPLFRVCNPKLLSADLNPLL